MGELKSTILVAALLQSIAIMLAGTVIASNDVGPEVFTVLGIVVYSVILLVCLLRSRRARRRKAG